MSTPTTTAHRWPRCPGCGAVAQPMHGTEHRPGCAHADDDPLTWLALEGVGEHPLRVGGGHSRGMGRHPSPSATPNATPTGGTP